MRMRACVSEPKWSRGTQQQGQQQLKREPSQKPNLNKVRRLFLLKAKLKKEKYEEKKYSFKKNISFIFLVGPNERKLGRILDSATNLKKKIASVTTRHSDSKNTRCQIKTEQS